MVQIQSLYGEVTPAQVEDLEARKGLRFPPDYRAVLLRSNGGRAVPSRFAIPGFHGKESVVNRLFGIHAGKHGNLEREIDRYRDRLPPSCVPIGNDPGGNLICLSVSGEHTGQVFFWDHDEELDNAGESRLDMSNMYLLAPDIERFLATLTENE